MAPSMESLSIEQRPGPLREAFGAPRRAFGLGALAGFLGVGLAVAALSHLGVLGPLQGTKFAGAPVLLRPTHLRTAPLASKVPVNMEMPADDAGASRRAVLGAAGVAVAGQLLGKPAEVSADMGVPDRVPTLFDSQPEGELWKFYPDFKFPGRSTEQAKVDFIRVVDNRFNKYKVTQGEIDQGGFKLLTRTPDDFYLQFENGLGRDDIVSAWFRDKKVVIRSNSRQGEWDKKVINYLATQLNLQPGWKCPKV